MAVTPGHLSVLFNEGYEPCKFSYSGGQLKVKGPRCGCTINIGGENKKIQVDLRLDFSGIGGYALRIFVVKRGERYGTCVATIFGDGDDLSLFKEGKVKLCDWLKALGIYSE